MRPSGFCTDLGQEGTPKESNHLLAPKGLREHEKERKTPQVQSSNYFTNYPGLMQSHGAAYTEKARHCERSEAIQGSIAGLLRRGSALLAMTTLFLDFASALTNYQVMLWP